MSTHGVISCPPPSKSVEYMASLIPPSPENFERIAQIQEKNESENKQRAREQRRKSAHARRAHSPSVNSADERLEAARVIQKTFRGYRARREMKGYSLDPSTRWVTAIREAQFRESTRPRARLRLEQDSHDEVEPEASHEHASSARQKWKKVSMVARRAGHDDLLSDSSSSSEDEDQHVSAEERAKAAGLREEAYSKRKHEARMMGLQYFLEMVDLKHRYGSNLRIYHEEWKKSETHENFFYWLDYGEGRYVETEACPRDRLEREQVRYLSREERQYYLVTVDSEGRLCWAKNGARIDTTEQYKDSIQGIVPSDDPTPAFNPAAIPPEDAQSENSDDSSLESIREADRAAKYTGSDGNEGKGVKKITHMSASTIFNKLLRKSVKRNTWIFVADTSFRLYVGIKNSGAFQHSSFLQGSRISAAGLIKIKNGRLASLSPLSGHYRPPVANFRAFVHSLKEAGVDMHRVTISKSYTVLVGLEAYVKTRRKGKHLMDKLVHRRDKIIAPEEVRKREEEAKDKSESAEKERRFLEEKQREEEAERDENRASIKVMQKLKVIPTEPKGQRDEVPEGPLP
ncbi:IQ domain-containing protein IQM5 [Paramyrothecium foliicola]|nr:IQ domain-containing protein IQM5 [Paramyrothecium foliicola]